MKQESHMDIADQIGADSWELLNFKQLKNSSAASVQVAALKVDQKWQEDHHNEISGRIDVLIQEIEDCTFPDCECEIPFKCGEGTE